MSTLRVQLLGDFCLTLDDTPVTSVNSARLQALVAYLVLHSDAPQSRQRLAFLFWSDTSETNARNNLRQLLFELRRALPNVDQFLEVANTTVQWRTDAPFTCDVDEFRRALENVKRSQDVLGTLENAVALYRSDLLPGCYDEWIAPEREQLREQFINALDKLIDLLDQAHEYSAAISYAQKLLRHDPLRESTHRCLMRLYATSGDRANALRTFHNCATTLQRELAVEPGTETRVEYERLLNLDTQPMSPPVTMPGTSPLIGRQREWNQLQSTWRDAASGRPQMLVLQGEAGIGKTRLAEELVSWVNRQGIANASAHCYAAESALPYAPIIAWLRANPLPFIDDMWMSEIARLLPELARTHPEWHAAPLTEEWQRQRLFEAIARALLTQSQPLLLFIDDLEWCDRDTLTWLRYLLRYDSQARLLIVGTLRVDEIDVAHPLMALFLALRQSTQLIEVNLGPLDEPETISLAANVLGRKIEPGLATQVYSETEGNPLFIVEMVRALSVDSQSLPPKVQAAISARLAHLSLPARELADIAAIIGRDFEFDVLAKASGVEEDVLVRGLDELWRRRIVREHGTLTYDFTHAKLREVILSTISPVRSRMLHRRVGEALETVHATNLDAVSTQIAVHYEQAGRAEQAIAYYERAGQAARQIYANEEAMAYYRRALALRNPSTPKEYVARLYENLGDLSHWIGQYDQARDTYQGALDWVDESVARARLHRKIGNTWREQYQYAEALQAYIESMRILNQHPDDALSAWWYEWIQAQLEIGTVHYWRGHVELGDQVRQLLEPVLTQHGTPMQRAGYFLHIASIQFRRNRNVASPEMIALAQATLAAHQEADNAAQIPAAQFFVGFSLLWGSNPSAAIEPMERALHSAEQRGDVSLQARCLTYLTIAYRQCDKMEEARRYAERGLQVATTAKMPEYIAIAKANQCWLAYRAGDFPVAQDLGRAAIKAWDPLLPGHASTPFKWLAFFPLLSIALDAQQLVQAVDYARKMLDENQQRLPATMATLLEQILVDWDGGKLELARTSLRRSIVLAQELKYL